MKEIIFNNWTFIRVFYLALGLYIAISSTMYNEWMGTMLGTYFASMGLFAFGCAGGQCYGGNCYTNNPIPDKDLETVEYEEVK